MLTSAKDWIQRHLSRPSGQVADAAMKQLGFVENSSSPPSGLKCAQQAGTILKKAGIDGVANDSVLQTIANAREKKWCERPSAAPGALAFTDPPGDRPAERRHMGVVSFPTDSIREQVNASYSKLGAQKQRFQYRDPDSGQFAQLTIYHNAGNKEVGFLQNDYDVKWASKVKFLWPPDLCGGVASSAPPARGMLTALLATSLITGATNNARADAVTRAPAASPAPAPASVRAQLVEKGEENQTKIESVFEIESPTRKGTRYAAYLVNYVENAQVIDANLALFELGAGSPVFLMRDTSLTSLRSATRDRLPEQDLRAILLEFGKIELRISGGKAQYATYVKERAKGGGINADERWLYSELLGKNFAN